MKVEKATARKPEVLRLADLLGIHPDHAFGLCVRFWSWCDDQFTSSDCHLQKVTFVTLDSIIGHTGFTKALAEVGWLTVNGTALEIPNFDRHLSKSAKKRAENTEIKRKSRGKDVTDLSPQNGDKSKTREEGEEEKNFQSGKAPIGANQSQPVAQSRLKKSHSQKKSKQPDNPMDLDGLNWEAVCQTAVAVARRIPAKSLQDRRAWFRYAVMAHKQFSEHWILDAAEAASRNELDGNRQAYFVAALQAKAAEFDEDCTPEVFNGIAERIEIPDRVWKVKIVPVEKPR